MDERPCPGLPKFDTNWDGLGSVIAAEPLLRMHYLALIDTLFYIEEMHLSEGA